MYRSFHSLPPFSFDVNARPLIGGVLSNPADKYSSFFQNSVFNRHPYLLPCVVAGILALFGVVVAYIFLEEVSCLGA